MKQILKVYFFLTFYFSLSGNQLWHDMPIDDLALVVKPVVDVSGYPLEIIFEDNNLDEIYAEIPYAPEKGKFSCLRFHQLLFNEVVKIKKELKDEYFCEVFNMFYDSKNVSRQSSVWILKKNLIKFNDLIKNKNNLEHIPFPFTKDKIKYLKNILTLVKPWKEENSRITYSLGTRFVRNKGKDTKTHFAAYIYDPILNKINIIFIEKSFCNIHYPKNKETASKLFLSHLLKLAKSDTGFIPYVWGGCSNTYHLEENNFSVLNSNKYGENIICWIRPTQDTPCCGFDCSGLILRVSQLYGIPYFFKNTLAIINNTKAITNESNLKEGDLLCYPGHVFIISNIKENKLIEASGYKNGHGKLHEIELNKVFKEINAFSDLFRFLRQNKPLERMDMTGQTIKTIHSFTICSFSSIWQ